MGKIMNIDDLRESQKQNKEQTAKYTIECVYEVINRINEHTNLLKKVATDIDFMAKSALKEANLKADNFELDLDSVQQFMSSDNWNLDADETDIPSVEYNWKSPDGFFYELSVYGKLSDGENIAYDVYLQKVNSKLDDLFEYDFDSHNWERIPKEEREGWIYQIIQKDDYESEFLGNLLLLYNEEISEEEYKEIKKVYQLLLDLYKEVFDYMHMVIAHTGDGTPRLMLIPDNQDQYGFAIQLDFSKNELILSQMVEPGIDLGNGKETTKICLFSVGRTGSVEAMAKTVKFLADHYYPYFTFTLPVSLTAYVKTESLEDLDKAEYISMCNSNEMDKKEVGRFNRLKDALEKQ